MKSKTYKNTNKCKINLLFGYSKIHHVRLQLSQLTAISGGRGFLLSDMCQ